MTRVDPAAGAIPTGAGRHTNKTRWDVHLPVIGRERMGDGRERRTVVHAPTARNFGLFPMRIGPHHDQALAEKAGHITRLRFDQPKRLRLRQRHVKAVNQYQILNFVPVLDEGIRTVHPAGKEQRYATMRSGAIGGPLKG